MRDDRSGCANSQVGLDEERFQIQPERFIRTRTPGLKVASDSLKEREPCLGQALLDRPTGTHRSTVLGPMVSNGLIIPKVQKRHHGSARRPRGIISPMKDRQDPVPPPPRVDIVIPVYNEEAQLESTVQTLLQFLERTIAYEWRLVIADNGSIDRTPEIGRRLAKDPRIQYLRLEQKGRGRALRKAWSESAADVVAYMDADLSTGLEALPALLDGLVVEGHDVAIGSRLMNGSDVRRGAKREIISRAYNLLIRAMFANRFSDAQCGFKALTRRAADELLPLVRDQSWFFDTELLLMAERRGLSIFEVPVRWVDDPDSRVDILSTAWEDVKGLLRVRFS